MVKVVCYILLKKVLEIRGKRAESEQGKREKGVRQRSQAKMRKKKLE